MSSFYQGKDNLEWYVNGNKVLMKYLYHLRDHRTWTKSFPCSNNVSLIF